MNVDREDGREGWEGKEKEGGSREESGGGGREGVTEKGVLRELVFMDID